MEAGHNEDPIVLSSGDDEDDDIQTVWVNRRRREVERGSSRLFGLSGDVDSSTGYGGDSSGSAIAIDDGDQDGDGDDVQITAIVTRPNRPIEEDRLERQRRELVDYELRRRVREEERNRRLQELRRRRYNPHFQRSGETSGRVWSFPSFDFLIPDIFGGSTIRTGPGEDDISIGGVRGRTGRFDRSDEDIPHDDLLLFLERQTRAAQATAFAGFDADGDDYSDSDNPMMSREERHFRRAIQRSLQDTGITRPNIRQEDIKGTPLPTLTRPGFTRSIQSTQAVLCARCDCELGVGFSEDSTKIMTDGDKLLSKRIFFAKCGHVYCGRCVNATVNRKSGQRRDPLRTCAVQGCTQSFAKTKKPFSEIYY